MSDEIDKKVILTVDDVSLNLAIIKNILSKDFDVRVAKSAQSALFILSSLKVDLILLDIEMPLMSGFELTDMLLGIPDKKDIPIIFVTSHAKSIFINKAAKFGAKDYIVKPIKPEILKEKVCKALDVSVGL